MVGVGNVGKGRTWASDTARVFSPVGHNKPSISTSVTNPSQLSTSGRACLTLRRVRRRGVEEGVTGGFTRKVTGGFVCAISLYLKMRLISCLHKFYLFCSIFARAYSSVVASRRKGRRKKVRPLARQTRRAQALPTNIPMPPASRLPCERFTPVNITRFIR